MTLREKINLLSMLTKGNQNVVLACANKNYHRCKIVNVLNEQYVIVKKVVHL
jgi:hypothetical protein